MKGTIKWFNDRKGYGFIAGSDGNEYFCHFSVLGDDFKDMGGRRNAAPGENVEFELTETDKGIAAINVRRTT